MVYQNKFLGQNYRQIAECLNVDPSTVCRIIQLFDETGTVKKRDYPQNFGTKKLGDIEKLLILQIFIEKPGIYLEEIAGKLQEETGTEVSKTTICRFLHKSSFTRQKMVIAARQRCDFLRSKYLLEISVYSGHPEFCIFIDETGADRRDSMRKFAYSLRRKPAMVTKLLERGQRVSAIVGMSHNGIIDFNTTLSTVNSDSFLKFVQNCLTLSRIVLIIKHIRVWAADFSIVCSKCNITLSLAIKVLSNNIFKCGLSLVLSNYKENFYNSYYCDSKKLLPMAL